MSKGSAKTKTKTITVNNNNNNNSNNNNNNNNSHNIKVGGMGIRQNIVAMPQEYKLPTLIM